MKSANFNSSAFYSGICTVIFYAFAIVALPAIAISAYAQSNAKPINAADSASAPAPSGGDDAGYPVDGGAPIPAPAANSHSDLQRVPSTSNGSDLPYPEEEFKQTDPGPANKNMPVDQD